MPLREALGFRSPVRSTDVYMPAAVSMFVFGVDGVEETLDQVMTRGRLLSKSALSPLSSLISNLAKLN